jgi:hypothetical protein
VVPVSLPAGIRPPDLDDPIPSRPCLRRGSRCRPGAPLDHESYGWQCTVARHHLWSFGEPPSVVAVDQQVYLASDPPVALGTFLGPRAQVDERLGLAGPWVEVPAEHAGDLLSAAAWARENVGTPGEGMATDRWH